MHVHLSHTHTYKYTCREYISVHIPLCALSHYRNTLLTRLSLAWRTLFCESCDLPPSFTLAVTLALSVPPWPVHEIAISSCFFLLVVALGVIKRLICALLFALIVVRLSLLCSLWAGIITVTATVNRIVTVESGRGCEREGRPVFVFSNCTAREFAGNLQLCDIWPWSMTLALTSRLHRLIPTPFLLAESNCKPPRCHMLW